MQHSLRCIDCNRSYDPGQIVYTCKCGGLLDACYSYEEISKNLNVETWPERPEGVWRYCELLPVDSMSAITLLEGGTSLQACQRLGQETGIQRVYVKNEGENPTGSFKDRGMTVGITKAMELGAKVVACASTGNTSASLAAYAAKAGIRAIVFIPSGKIALGKLSQAIAHGAEIVRMKGSFDDAFQTVLDFTTSHSNVYLLNSVNPYRIEGQKTLAFEVYEQLGRMLPDNLILPVGNAGNISAIWKGFRDLRKLGLVDQLPKMMGIQAEGAAPIARAFREHSKVVKQVDKPETVATAIRIGAPVSWKKALQAVHDSKGLVESVTDREILNAQRDIAQLEGLFIEPASAASIAGLRKLSAMGRIVKDEVTVCVATGHGLKDPDIIIKNYELPPEVDPGTETLKKILRLPEVIT